MESERKYSSLSFSILKRGWSITWVIFHLNFLQIEIGHGCMLYLVFGGQLSHMPLADGVGSWSFYIVFFAVDYITGCAASLKEKKGLKSTIGFWGLFKKGLILLMVFMVHRIDIAHLPRRLYARKWKSLKQWPTNANGQPLGILISDLLFKCLNVGIQRHADAADYAFEADSV